MSFAVFWQANCLLKAYLNVIIMRSTFLSIVISLLSIIGFANETPFGTKMTLVKMNGKEISGTNFYLTIDQEKLSIFGKSGCNSFNVSFQAKSNNTCIKTQDGISTMVACDEGVMKLESEFMNTLQNRKFKIKTKGDKVQFKNWWGKTILEFQTQTEKSVWTYIGQNEWQLIQLNNVGKDYGKASIKFDTTENRVSGNTGCNNFFGSYNVQGEYISFAQMGATKMLCDEESNKTENEFFKILSGQKLRYDVADQTINLYDGDRLVMMFGVVR